MAVFTFSPSNSSGGAVTPRKRKTQFGDGYVQEFADGINQVMRSWNLVFNNIQAYNADATKTTLTSVNAFLEARAGWEKFQWTQPPPFDGEGAKWWVCEQWGWTYNGGLIIGMTARFDQRPA